MTQQELIPGTNRDVSKSQWFSPPDLAKRVVEWAHVADEVYHRSHACSSSSFRVLEPSAGNGALVRPLVAAGAEVHAIELDDRYGHELRELVRPRGAAWIGDSFLEFKPYEQPTFDLCVQNPPYEQGQDVAFVLHALKFAPRVVGIFRSQILHGKARKRDLWSKVRPTRIAYLSERPDFGGDYGAMTDFVVLELVARDEFSAPIERASLEWW